ncbi:MAG: 5-formyltetrahydrofolate cyclo-ligase [Hyphomicrobium sp.]
MSDEKVSAEMAPSGNSCAPGAGGVPLEASVASIGDAKKAMRQAAKARRAETYRQCGAAAGARVAGHGIGFAGVRAPAIVTGFLSIGEEIDPTRLMSRLIGEGYTLALPVMEAKGKPLVFRSWRPGDPLAETMWGIHEPLASAAAVEPDVVLGPLLAFDLRGYRLGYGGGFYDRTLARLRSLKRVVSIGLAYDEQRVDAVPHLDYDERLDWVLTPSGPLKCSAAAE